MYTIVLTQFLPIDPVFIAHPSLAAPLPHFDMFICLSTQIERHLNGINATIALSVHRVVTLNQSDHLVALNFGVKRVRNLPSQDLGQDVCPIRGPVT